MSKDTKSVDTVSMEIDQSIDSEYSPERIQQLIQEIDERSLEAKGKLQVPAAWKKPGFHNYFMKVDPQREEELTKQYHYRVARNAQGETYRVDSSGLILMEIPDQLHEHLEKVKNEAKHKRTQSILVDAAESANKKGLYQTSDSGVEKPTIVMNPHDRRR